MRLRRRSFLAGLFGTAAVGSAWAEPAAMPVVGFLSDGAPEAWTARVDGVKRGLAEQGFVEGRNLAFEFRWARGRYDLLPGLAADLARRQVSAIVCSGSEKVTRAAKAAPMTIPIVATMAGDTVARGIVASVNRPGGNFTVVSLFTSSDNALVTKRMDLLHECCRRRRSSAGWWRRTSSTTTRSCAISSARRAPPASKPKSSQGGERNRAREGFHVVGRARCQRYPRDRPAFFRHRPLIIALGARNRVPVLYEWREFVDEDGFMSYGTILAEIHRQAGVYVGRILKGEKAADLPVVQQSKFALVINLKTAKALGLTLPSLLVARADDVIA